MPQHHQWHEYPLVQHPDPDPSWRRQAACRGCDPALFFADNGGGVLAAAKAICHRCPVETACLEYALAAGERWGVYGGTSERERREIWRSRRRRGAA